jgi:hypothetical protein
MAWIRNTNLEKIQFCEELEIAHAALEADQVLLLVL